MLSKSIKKHKNHISFHTPAHSGVLNNEDITELIFSDNLLNPQGVILKSEKRISEIYGAENSVYITGGGTTAVHIALYTVRDKTVLIAGNCHKSAFSAVRLYGIKAFYVKDLDNINKALEETGATVLFLTSPDYFGNLAFSESADFLLRGSLTVIVDESHGAHFAFSSLLPDSAVSYADIAVHSAHKTLPVLTGGAMLHFKDKFAPAVHNALNEIHSTSPQYPVMLSLERASEDFYKNGEKYYLKIKTALDKFGKNLEGLKDFEILKTDDFSRLVIKCKNAKETAKYLEEKGIFAEAVYRDLIVFIVTPFNFKHLGKVFKIIKNSKPIQNSEFRIQNEGIIKDFGSLSEEVKRLDLSACRAEFEAKDISDSIGRVAINEIGLYPPGVPFIFGGDIITKETADFIHENKDNLFGLCFNKIFVVK
ncbi:MAG: hypothetical protein FWD49_00380 [Firmicutes bacterium]|nr:hypothetical protein [Bacillota bacterium]